MPRLPSSRSLARAPAGFAPPRTWRAPTGERPGPCSDLAPWTWVVAAALVFGCSAKDDKDQDKELPPGVAACAADLPPFGASGFTPAPCTSKQGDKGLIRLRGTVWTGSVVLPEGEVFVSRATGRILCVGSDCTSTPDADKATVLCTDGVITPGLINAHDHPSYNYLPPFQAPTLYDYREDWRSSSAYSHFKSSYGAVSAQAACEVDRWAEIRGLVAGATSVQGSAGPPCIAGWQRNLDANYDAATGIPGHKTAQFVNKITTVGKTAVAGWLDKLSTGDLAAAILHLAEGTNDEAREEWEVFESLGLNAPGVSIIHGTALKGPELARARQGGVRMIWSPQSNIALYGTTNRIPAALKMGIPVAIGPDWTPSGTMSPLEELKCARHVSQQRWGCALSDETIVRMATVEAAEAMGVGDELGRLTTGALADIAVFAGDRGMPFRTVLEARAEDVVLTMVGGRALYGDATLLKDLLPAHCEPLDVCGRDKLVCAADPDVQGGQTSLVEVKDKLQKVIAGALADDSAKPDFQEAFAYAYQLHPLFQCGAEAEAALRCGFKGDNVNTPGKTDGDGDGVPDDTDKCPSIFDPDQGDLDGDGVGDGCDPCPFALAESNCPDPGPGDVDGDDIPDDKDNCPGLPNPQQADKDGDAKGDVCDECPTGANPGDEPCPAQTVAITELAEHFSEYPTDTYVKLESVVITAIKKASSSSPAIVWVQQEKGGAWGGMAIEPASDHKLTAKEGDLVTVRGRPIWVFGLAMLRKASFEVTGQGTGKALPSSIKPAEVNGKDASKPWRSLLVEVTDVEVVAENAYGEVEISGGLLVDDLLVKWGEKGVPTMAKGEKLKALRGVLYFSYGNVKMLPRSAEDFDLSK